jgi:lysine decarboxylase
MCNSVIGEQIIFETHSTHKLLAAFSQASMIHIKGKIDKEIMDECYMMHTSTSPLYQITASCEIAAAMMRGERGFHLINRSIKRATNFRKEIKKLRESASDWYFDIWQPDEIDEAECWELKPEEAWHGFKQQDAKHIYLDPIKVTVLTPGIKNNTLKDFGIPASIVTMYLDYHGVIVEKTGPYTMLFLFSIGISRPKSMKLLTILNDFKTDFDANRLVREMLPNLYQEYPQFYRKMRIKELAEKIHHLMQQYDLPNMMYQAFDCLPEIEMTPHQAFQKLVKGYAKTIKMSQLENHTSAVMVLPYPPGVPLIMPGEKITVKSRKVLDYLIMLENIGKEVPGFASDIHGAEEDEDGDLTIKVLD